MSLWIFKCYCSPSDQDPVGDWYNGLSDVARAKFDTRLEFFRDNPHTSWGPERFKPLVGFEGIYEVRFQVKNVLYRPLGYFGPGRREFTFLVPAREQGDRFVPRDAPELAEQRKKKIELGEASTYECCF